MNLLRHISKLNAQLEAELGHSPLYRWVHSEAPEFRHAMRKMDEFGNLEMDYVCCCGRNVSVHSAECKMTVAEPVWEWRKIVPHLRDQWVLCALQPPDLTEAQWLERFGTRGLYPAHGEYMPVGTEDRLIALHPGKIPGESFNLAVIRGRQRSREVHLESLAHDQERAQQKFMDDRLEGFKYRFKSVLPVRPNPGCVDGPVSLPSTKKELVSL